MGRAPGDAVANWNIIDLSDGFSPIRDQTTNEPILTYYQMDLHYNDITMGKIASQITSLTIVYSSVYSGADERKHQSFASLAFVWGIHRWPVIYPHKGQVTRKTFPFDDVIMGTIKSSSVKLEWKYTKMVLWETAFENIVCKSVAILLGPRGAKRTYVIPT